MKKKMIETIIRTATTYNTVNTDTKQLNFARFHAQVEMFEMATDTDVLFKAENGIIEYIYIYDTKYSWVAPLRKFS